MPAAKRIVFATFGSLGDVLPFLAIGRELLSRGHAVTLATSEYHRTRIEAEGFRFHPVRPDIAEFGGPAGLMRTYCGGPLGPVQTLRKLILPRLRESAADLMAAAREADFLGSVGITYAAPLVAEKLGLTWAGMALQPMGMFSARDPSLLPGQPPFRLSPFLTRCVIGAGRVATRRLVRPIAALRAEMGLPPTRAHPFFEGQFSPHLNLALFSPAFGRPQSDWPRETVCGGFPFFDRSQSPMERLHPECATFLESGEAPLVFTLGSTVVELATPFYRESLELARRLGRRALFLTGPASLRNLPPHLPDGMLAVPYAPHAAVFPRAAAIIHQGGIGTTAQALRAGRPQLLVPFGHDQPDNAIRTQRLGCGRVIAQTAYSARSASRLLGKILADTAMARRAREVAELLRAETGANTAAAAIEQVLGC
ncbi:MAG: glycosyltransferase [Opitutus sp.]|nr:glycosyltransferase [Opitutus sp.]